MMQFDEDMRPFVMEGRTFLSVRALSEALALPVDFDPRTNIVYLGRVDGTYMGDAMMDSIRENPLTSC